MKSPNKYRLPITATAAIALGVTALGACGSKGNTPPTPLCSIDARQQQTWTLTAFAPDVTTPGSIINMSSVAKFLGVTSDQVFAGLTGRATCNPPVSTDNPRVEHMTVNGVTVGPCEAFALITSPQQTANRTFSSVELVCARPAALMSGSPVPTA